ncbi:MAG: hypothetical protein LAT53_06840 [Idiomarina sp.]|nr:hypothetical protein [Idiomarina sp.]
MLLFLGAVERPIKDFLGNVKFTKNVTEQEKSVSEQSIIVRSEDKTPIQSSPIAPEEHALAEYEQAGAEHHLSAAPSSDIQELEAAEQRVADQISVLLAEEPSLHSIIETNIALLGEVSGSAAFLNHQALLRLINQTEQIQPMSIVCSNNLCNILIYGADEAQAARFSEHLLHEQAAVAIVDGSYRLFTEAEHNFSHIVLETTAMPINRNAPPRNPPE